MDVRAKEILRNITQLKAETLSPGDRLVLFGSQARGDANSESDWDLLMLLNKEHLTQKDFDVYAYPFVLLGLRHGEYFSVKQYTKEEWEMRKGTPFYKNVMQEGIEL